MNASETDRQGWRTLVFGIGNSLRRDDGIGPAVVRVLQDRHLPHAELAVVHQLTPELADTMAAVDVVVFVDAALDIKALRIARVEPAVRTAPAQAHYAEPAGLLAFTQRQYGRAPQAWVVGIPAHDLGYGEGFSDSTRAHLNAAVEAVGRIMDQTCTNST